MFKTVIFARRARLFFYKSLWIPDILIYYVSGDTLYLRVAVTPEYHAHKRSPYYEYRTISISYLSEIFYKEVIELKRQKIEELEIRKKALNAEIYKIKKEIANIDESLEKYQFSN